MSGTIVIDGEEYEYAYRSGDSNGVMAACDILGAVEHMKHEEKDVRKVIVSLSSIRDLRTEENVYDETDIIMSDKGIDVITRLWWYRRYKGNPTLILHDYPIHEARFDSSHNQIGLLIGEDMNILIDA